MYCECSCLKFYDKYDIKSFIFFKVDNIQTNIATNVREALHTLVHLPQHRTSCLDIHPSLPNANSLSQSSWCSYIKSGGKFWSIKENNRIEKCVYSLMCDSRDILWWFYVCKMETNYFVFTRPGEIQFCCITDMHAYSVIFWEICRFDDLFKSWRCQAGESNMQ